MFRPRIIPILLLKDFGLVKTTKFKNPRYLGDPVNTVKIFNDLEADELIFLDIEASSKNTFISPELVKEIGDEAFMPFGVGGGIKRIEDAVSLICAGAEKIFISSEFVKNPKVVQDISRELGSQSVGVCLDLKKNFFGKYEVRFQGGKFRGEQALFDYLRLAENFGAGEVMVNCIDLDGMMSGYDIELLEEINEKINIPLLICGGAGNLSDFKKAYDNGVQGMCAGSMFVYQGLRNGILINYPSKKELYDLFSK